MFLVSGIMDCGNYCIDCVKDLLVIGVGLWWNSLVFFSILWVVVLVVVIYSGLMIGNCDFVNGFLVWILVKMWDGLERKILLVRFSMIVVFCLLFLLVV